MRHDPRLAFERHLRDEVVLVALLAASLALFLSRNELRSTYELPELRLVLTTLFALAGGLVALLTGTRFKIEGRRFDLLLCSGFFTISVSWLLFTLVPTASRLSDTETESWTGLAGILLGCLLVAAAPFARGRVARQRTVLLNLLAGLTLILGLIWTLSRGLDVGLPSLDPSGTNEAVPVLLIVSLALQALLHLTAVVGFSNRYRLHGEDLDRWLALGATLMLFASLHLIFTPLVGTYVSQGDFLVLLAYAVLLVGVWRAIQSTEFRRAVAEERARVAREIHDGLAQYLFAVSTHVSMLEKGADPVATIPHIKAAATAAQQEARFAILALSSAAGSAPFDAALRRYVDVLTADGALEVELDIDGTMHLAPDEQIEIFRIVQEGLANARRHAGASRAWVVISQRGVDRVVVVRVYGTGFEQTTALSGQGLKNIRERVASMGGVFSLASAPGRGTSLEVVLRP
jgi:signal transduction histidine kinase